MPRQELAPPDAQIADGARPAAGSRCETAPASVVAAIESGLTVVGAGSLEDAAKVKSADYGEVHFHICGHHRETVARTDNLRRVVT